MSEAPHRHDSPEPAEAPDPVHETDGGPRFAPDGDDDVPEDPTPAAEPGAS